MPPTRFASERFEMAAPHSTVSSPPRSAAAGALVLRAVGLRQDPAGAFVLARAVREVAALARGRERAALKRILQHLTDLGAPERAFSDAAAAAPRLAEPVAVEPAGRAHTLAGGLACWAAVIEPVRRFPEADEAMTLALELAPDSAELVLHAARIARKLGDGDRARDLYRRALRLDGGRGPIGHMARIGQALLSEDAERELARALRCALRGGDSEAAGVALEERARLRRGRGEVGAAARDLAMATLRYTDALDRGRVSHRLADLAVATGDALAAREALLVALEVGDEGQREHARVRLHSISRDLGDRLGQRRWRSSARPALVSMGLSARRSTTTAAPKLSRWRGLAQG